MLEISQELNALKHILRRSRSVSRPLSASAHQRCRDFAGATKVQTGSIAKTFIAAGILRLVTEQRLSLDSPVAPLLPDLVIENPWASSDPVLLRHLLDHTAGLDDARLSQVFSLNAVPDSELSTTLQTKPLRIRTRPGSRLSYSNVGYTLLGMVIERITNAPYETYLDTHLLRPLNMHESSFRFVSQDGPAADGRLAMGHFERAATQAVVPLYLRPAGQFTTTASDMGRFARFLMSDGQVDGKPFIEAALLRSMGRPTTTEAATAGLRDAGYGLGLNSRDRHGVVGNCHVGTTIGFRANFCLFPDVQKAFFVAFNADVETANYDRFDAILIQQLEITSVVPMAGVAPPDDIEEWQGIYVLAPNRSESFAYLDHLLNFASVQWRGQQLQLKPFQGAVKYLLPVKDRLFRAEDRVRPSHVLLISDEGQQIISDGFRSYAKTSLWEMLPLWASLVAGVLGIIYLLALGLLRLACRRLRVTDPLFVPFVAAASLFAPVPLFMGQSFLQLGDLTYASALLAVVTGFLPIAMLYGLWRVFRVEALHPRRAAEVLAMISVLQWALVLVFWGLLPLRLWA